MRAPTAIRAQVEDIRGELTARAELLSRLTAAGNQLAEAEHPRVRWAHPARSSFVRGGTAPGTHTSAVCAPPPRRGSLRWFCTHSHGQHDEATAKVQTLQADRATVEELLAKRAAVIAQAAAMLRFNADYHEAAELVAAKLEQVKAVELPRDAAAAAPLLAQLAEIKADAEANDDKIKAATASGNALIQANHAESAEVQRKLDALVSERAALGKGPARGSAHGALAYEQAQLTVEARRGVFFCFCFGRTARAVLAIEERQKLMLDAVQLVDFNRDADDIDSFLALKEVQVASGSAGSGTLSVVNLSRPGQRRPQSQWPWPLTGDPGHRARVRMVGARGHPGDSLDAVRSNQNKHERLEQELAQEEGKLKALNALGQSVRRASRRPKDILVRWLGAC